MTKTIEQASNYDELTEVLQGKNDNQQIQILWDLGYKFLAPKGLSENTRIVENHEGKTGIFIQNIGLLSFDGDYFPNIIAEDEEGGIRCFISGVEGEYKVFPLERDSELKHFFDNGKDTFTHLEEGATIYRTRRQAGDILTQNTTIH